MAVKMWRHWQAITSSSREMLCWPLVRAKRRNRASWEKFFNNEIAITVTRNTHHLGRVIHLYRKKIALLFTHTRRTALVCQVTHTPVRPVKPCSAVVSKMQINKLNSQPRLSKRVPKRHLEQERAILAIEKRQPPRLNHVKPLNACSISPSICSS